MQESHDIVDCNSGGDKDIVALALRYVLLEASKTPGFLFLDEIEKRLDSPETEEKMIEFIKELQKETGRQVFMITHSQRMVDAVTNPIILEKTLNRAKSEIKEVMDTPHVVKERKFTKEEIQALDNKEVTTNASETPKKKGRPKGSKNKESGKEA
jgi:ABC-type Mn2+/Zn2+ transport system ATPase subunit